MHTKYYRTERERLDAEQAEFEAGLKNRVDFEKMLRHFPKKFNVAKCLSNERTFPANVTTKIKASLTFSGRINTV